MQFRQGDVFLRRVDRAPSKSHRLVPRDNGRVILAYGELTGHAHAIDSAVAKLFQNSAGERLLEVSKYSAELTHEEHGTITLPPGTYEVVQQREYEEGNGSRFVGD